MMCAEHSGRILRSRFIFSNHCTPSYHQIYNIAMAFELLLIELMSVLSREINLLNALRGYNGVRPAIEDALHVLHHFTILRRNFD